jgi:dTMP kinase
MKSPSNPQSAIRNPQSALFFSFDGIDGVGKSTQARLFAAWLREQEHEVVECRDPGSTPLGEKVRGILLDTAADISLTAEMLLYMAARAQLVHEIIRPALAAGKTVVSDRFLLSNVVYQGHAGGLDVETLWRVGEVATGGLRPDLTFVLDLPIEAAASRINRQLDRMEQKGRDYRERLRKGFLAEAARDERVIVVQADKSIDEVQQMIRAASNRLRSSP